MPDTVSDATGNSDTPDKADAATALTQLGDGIVHAITHNPKALAVADGVVTFEPTIYAAIELFVSIFRKHHNVPAVATTK